MSSRKRLRQEEEEEEEWRSLDFLGFPKYSVSSLGNVKNQLRMLKLLKKDGYVVISLTGECKKKRYFKVHRLVAFAFLPNPLGKKTVNHKNHDPYDNRLCNLEWATTAEQNAHKRRCSKEVKEMISSRSVWRLDPETGERLQRYPSIRFASEWVFVNRLTRVVDFDGGSCLKSKISKVALKKQKTAFGFGWEYCTEEDNKFDDEVWKPIDPAHVCGREGYSISNYGRVRNPRGRITEGNKPHATGYIWVTISPKQYLLHRLVAKTFLTPPGDDEQRNQVNHKDGNKQNCHVSNLEWCTGKENQEHKVTTGLSNCTKPVTMFRDGVPVQSFISKREASLKTGMPLSLISKSLLGKKPVDGVRFKFSGTV